MAADSFDDLLLQAYPNPGRHGCPATAQLEYLAENPLPLDHPISVHVRECSPCFAEFCTFRDAKRATSKRQTAWRFTALTAAAAALLFLFSRSPMRQAPPSPFAAAQLDFSTETAERGTEGNAATLPSIPAGTLLLQITLPAGTDSGQYDIEIRSAANLSNTLQAQQTLSLGQSSNKLPSLTYRLLPPALPAGNYALAWRPHGSPLWHYNLFVTSTKGRQS